jgi:hypothetical protein
VPVISRTGSASDATAGSGLAVVEIVALPVMAL